MVYTKIQDGGQEKPEVEITFERQVMAPRFNGYPHIIDHARLHYVTATLPDVVRLSKFKMAAIRPEVEITFDR